MLIVAGGVSARVAGKVGGYSNKSGGNLSFINYSISGNYEINQESRWNEVALVGPSALSK